jgi:hypothetical protein
MFQRRTYSNQPRRSIALSLRERDGVRGCCYRTCCSPCGVITRRVSEPLDGASTSCETCGSRRSVTACTSSVPARLDGASTRPSPRPSPGGRGRSSSTTWPCPSFVESLAGSPFCALPGNRRFRAPAPTAAKEEVTSDPSPCPLPEGEGSLRRGRRLWTSTASGSHATETAQGAICSGPVSATQEHRHPTAGRRDRQCREPSPSGRGQGEGSNITFSLAAIGAEARTADSQQAPSALTTQFERTSDVLASSIQHSTFNIQHSTFRFSISPAYGRYSTGTSPLPSAPTKRIVA